MGLTVNTRRIVKFYGLGAEAKGSFARVMNQEPELTSRLFEMVRDKMSDKRLGDVMQALVQEEREDVLRGDYHAWGLFECGPYQAANGERHLFRLELIGSVAMFFSLNGRPDRIEKFCLASEITETEASMLAGV